MMPLTRRRFLGMAASLPLASSQRLTRSRSIPSTDAAAPRRLLLDAGEQCVLHESLKGFERGLATASIRFECTSKEAIWPAHLIIVPGAVMDSPEFAKSIRSLTDCGSTVLYESAAAFSDREAFETERRLLRNYFGLSLQDPKELWPVERQIDGPPYVRYNWPAHAMIRDFSRVITVSARTALSSSYIAYVGTGVPVACRHLVGKGAFIYLGSPLGPHVGFGDAEAQRLLETFIGSSEPT